MQSNSADPDQTPRSAVCTVCQCPSPGFLHDKNSASINNRYLDFVHTRGFTSLVNDIYVDNNLKEI